MDIEVILDRDHGDVQEFGVLSLHLIYFVCNSVCKKTKSCW